MKPQHRKNDTTSTTSSIDSRESDAFSLHSNHSSETSVEEVNSHMAPKNMDAYPAIDADYGPPPAIPPRRYAPCVAKQDAAFQPTCTLRPTRCATNDIAHHPTASRKMSSLSRHRKSLDSHPSMGAISQSPSRSESNKSDRGRSTSPTLSEAEGELERSLDYLADDAFLGRLADNDLQHLTPHQNSLAEPWKKHMTKLSAEPAPLLPRRSSKRQSVINVELFRLSRVPNDHIASQIARGRSLKRDQGLTITISPASHGITGKPVLPPLQLSAKQEPRIISPSDAEKVLYKILQSLDGLDELFATAVVSSGLYRVFKRHELELIKSVLHNSSAPAWEFRETAFPGHDLLHDEDLEMTRPFEEYTPTSYLHLQKCDEQILRKIKTMIKEKCQSFVRPEISAALVDEKSPNSSRVNDALWRIWSFCKIFGSGRGREDDIVAQQDWLKGGAQVHQQACTFSLVSTDFMNDTLISAPDCFAKGNEGGLTAEQLFDMMELWNCLGVLLQGFRSRTADARKFGIYDHTEIRGGDIDGEEMMLDEWCHHLLSFGLSTVLVLARPCDENNAIAFELAHERSLTSWKPPVGGSSRRSFLKEAASRVYEDRLAHVYAESSTRELQRLMSKQRVKKYIHELKTRKGPIIRQSQDRPMSEWESVMSSLIRQHPSLPTTNNISSHVPSFRPTSTIAQEISTHIAELPAAVPAVPPTARALLPPLITQSPPRRTVAQPLLPSPPSSTISGPRDRSSIATTMASIIEYPDFRTQDPVPQIPFPNHPAFRAQRPHVTRKETDISPSSRDSSESDRSAVLAHHPVFQQHQAQADIFDSPAHEHTAEKAIYRIVEMGFTAEQAREALRVTDLGDGLRVDRAVELLLSRQM
ncbi:uncharacterized protein EKO05_0006557 [Ascochyta rabiei]|nr:uncharacterized protein EKO05_0006557 [Ascochyta rabiei]UPX16139.1 hypothetical protein EKO05_0006557 [Ascochyta rabiei]